MSHKMHSQRPDLIGEHSIGDVGQIISFILFFSIWMIDNFFIKSGTSINQLVPLYSRLPVAIILFLTSLNLALKSINTIFVQKRDKPEVIRSGLYGIIRHPMYLSEILLYAAFLSLSLSYWTMIAFVIIIVFLFIICKYEEKLLIDYFGDEYIKYKNEVPMWIPRIRFKKHA